MVSVWLVALVVVGGGCAISEEQEMKLGREAHGQFEQEFGGVYRDTEIQDYVQKVGLKMARHAGRPNMEWEFKVLNSDQVNAFAVPGGYIYITRGLLFQLENEAQLAGVLGHEAGHIAHKHSVKQIQRAQAAQGVAIGAEVIGQVFGVGGMGDITSVVASLTVMSYGRDQEREADMSGLKYMTKEGYNPRGLVQVMKILKAAMGGGGGPEFLSTHPDPGNRQEYLTEKIKKDYARLGREGEYKQEDFERVVLRRRSEIKPIDLNGGAWCLTCQKVLVSRKTEPGATLLEDVP
jgi:predicted Zn-dependent protease